LEAAEKEKVAAELVASDPITMIAEAKGEFFSVWNKRSVCAEGAGGGIFLSRFRGEENSVLRGGAWAE